MQGKQYAPKETPHPLINTAHGMHAYNKYFYLRTGVIEDVDYDRYTLTVSWIQRQGVNDKVPHSFPYIGPAGGIGCLPEKGTIGIFGYFNEDMGKGSPLLLATLPSGLMTGFNGNKIKIVPDSLATDDVNEIRFLQRQLMQGDIMFISPEGGGLWVNTGVEMFDANGNGIVLRSGDGSIIQTSLNNFMFSDGVALNMGQAIRNGLAVYDMKGNKLDEAAALFTLDGGKDNIYITPFGDDIGHNSEYYTEFRIDADEFGNGQKDLNDINSDTGFTGRDPIVVFALSNFIGADKKDNTTYGRILRPVLFTKPDDKEGNFSLIRATQNNKIDETTKLGLAYTLYLPKVGAFMGIDKEGHYNVALPASKINPLGAGRSMSMLAQGSLKEVWGSDARDANSWDYVAKGGIKWDIGSHNDKYFRRSIDIRTDSGVFLQINGNDAEGYAKHEVVNGDVLEEVASQTSVINANNTITVKWMKKENITGGSSLLVQGDYSINTLGVFTETAMGEKQCKFGSRTTTIVKGSDKNTLLIGNIEETIKGPGKRITMLTAGSIENTVLSGTIKQNITAGNYKLDIKAGGANMNLKTGALGTDSLAVKMKGATTVIVDTPITRIGRGASLGGVVAGAPGKPNHFDYMTGAPLRGSMKVGIA